MTHCRQFTALLLLLTGLTAGFGLEQVADTKFSVNRGFFDSPFQVEITTDTDDALIRYTTDGSQPTESEGLLYQGPVAISQTTVLRAIAYKAGMDATNVDTQTYLFPDLIDLQAALQPGFPDVWESNTGSDVGADYAMDAGYPAGGEEIREALMDLPSLSIVMETDHLFGRDGVYNNGGRDNNSDWEYPCSIEMIYPDTSRNSYQVNCGIQPRSHRADVSRKRGFKFEFKSTYGPGKLDKNVFKNALAGAETAQNSFDALVLRSGYMENYTGASYNMDLQFYVRDVMTRNAQLGVAGYGTRNLFVHVYLNGLYWGMFNLTEMMDEVFLSDYFGGQKDDWFMAKSNADSDDNGEIVAGSASRYLNLLNRVGSEDLSADEDYQAVLEYIDPVKFADYMIIQNYFAVGDWPDNNWVFVMKNGSNPEPGFFICWDAEKTWLDGDDEQSFKHARYSPYLYDEALLKGRSYRAVPSRIWRAMISNADFRMLFADRVYHHLFNDGVLTDTRNLARFETLTQSVSKALLADQKRWSDDDNRGYNPGFRYTKAHWQAEVDRVFANIQNNVGDFIGDFRAHGLYPELLPPVFSQRGGPVDAGFDLDLANPNADGVIYYCTDGTDPRIAGGAVSGTAQSGGQIEISGTVTVKARVFSGGVWSPLEEATFFGPADMSALMITEIMYHPPDSEGTDGDRFEFIEVKNTGSGPLNISSVAFTNGIDYTFAEGSILEPNEFRVLARDPDRFFSKYGRNPDGAYSGKLDNGGERVTLSDASGSDIFTVRYDDKAPWPVSPDSGGYSLVPVNLNSNPDPDEAGSWRASLFPGGSPWLDDTTRYVPPPPPPDRKSVLFVSGSSNLNGDDLALLSRLQILGYDVLEADDDDVSAAQADGQALVFVSETVASTKINSQFRDVEVPVMSCEPYIYDDMGMTGPVEDTDLGKIDQEILVIQDASHPAAAGLSGAVRVASTVTEMCWGIPGGDAHVIATWQDSPGRAAIFVYDAGAAMPAGVAAGRRVGFFFKEGMASSITAEGWELFDAAVNWAVEGDASSESSMPVNLPLSMQLYQNYPNPFNPVTTIGYALPETAEVRLDVVDVTGRLVERLVDGMKTAGTHRVVWNAGGNGSAAVSSGMYFSILTVDGKQAFVRKMLRIQ